MSESILLANRLESLWKSENSYELDKLLLTILEASAVPKRRFDLAGELYLRLTQLLSEASLCRTLIILKILYSHSREVALRRQIAIDRGVMLSALLGLDHAELEVRLHYLNLLAQFTADDGVIGDFSRSIDESTRVHVNIFSGLLDLLVQLSSTRTDLGLQGMLAGVSVLNRLVSVDLDLADHFSNHIRNQQLLCFLLLSEQTYYLEYQTYLFSTAHNLAKNNPSGISAQLLEAMYQALHNAAANKRVFVDPAFSAPTKANSGPEFERKEKYVYRSIEELEEFFFTILQQPAIDKSRVLLGNCIKENDVILQFLARVAGFPWSNKTLAFQAVARSIRLAASFLQLTLNPLTKNEGGVLVYHFADVYWSSSLKTALCDLLEAVDPPDLKAAKGTVMRVLQELLDKAISDVETQRYAALLIRIILWSCGNAGDETPRSSAASDPDGEGSADARMTELANDCIMRLTHRLDADNASPEYKLQLVQVIAKLGLHADVSAYCMQTVWGFFVTTALSQDISLANTVARELLKLLRGYLPSSGEVLTELISNVRGRAISTQIDDIPTEPEHDIPKKTEKQRAVFQELHVNVEFLGSLGAVFDKARAVGLAEIAKHAEVISVVCRVLYLCKKSLPLPVSFVLAVWPVLVTNEAGFDTFNGAVAALVLMRSLEHEKSVTAELTGSLVSMHSVVWMQRTLETLNSKKHAIGGGGPGLPTPLPSRASKASIGGGSISGYSEGASYSGGGTVQGLGLWENQLACQSLFVVYYFRKVLELSFVGSDQFKTTPLADRVGLLRLVCGFITRAYLTSTTLDTSQGLIHEGLTLLLHAADPRRSGNMVEAIRVMRIGEYWPTLIPHITNYADPVVETLFLGIFKIFTTAIEHGWFDDSIFVTLDAVFKESCLLFLANEPVGLLCTLLDLDPLKPSFRKTHQYVLHRLIVNTEKRFYYARAENVARLRKVALALSAAIKPAEHTATSYRQSYTASGATSGYGGFSAPR